jgi:hypothetical protein
MQPRSIPVLVRPSADAPLRLLMALAVNQVAPCLLLDPKLGMFSLRFSEFYFHPSIYVVEPVHNWIATH